MTTFIIMTLSITVGILLAGVLGAVILLNPFVMKLYMNYAMKLVEHSYDLSEKIEEDKEA